jgi:membrane-bound lytic murein transglycosylase D
MNRFRPFPLMLVFFFFYFPAALMAFPATSSEPSPDESTLVSDNQTIPKGIADLMQASHAKYMEGSGLIKAGDSGNARESFNKAVDLLLQSDWDLASTTVLNRYFQELIQRIQEDESRYLLAFSDDDNPQEEVEDAVIDELNDLDLIPITIDPALQEALKADLAKTKYEIPITVNDMVARSLDYWLNKGRKYFEDGLIRSGQYRPIIEKIFREETIPLDLMYLAQVESLFKPHAVSRARAKGIWQFEKATAIRYGLKVTRDVDERSDPEKSTRAAARYLNDLFAMFKDWNLALAAYNWGEGKVQRLIKSTGLNDFWQLVDLRRRLPQETKNHVPLIQASIILGRNPEAYGLPTKLDPPLKYTEVSISKPIDLRAAAKVLRTSIDELKKLNPSLRGFTTPANYPNFQLKVPTDVDPETHEQLASLPKAKVRLPAEFDGRYKVKRGDTLSQIASRYRISVTELKQANNFTSKTTLKAGAWIQVPSRSVNSKKDSVKSASEKSKKSGTSTGSLAKKSSKAKTASAKTKTPARSTTKVASLK